MCSLHSMYSDLLVVMEHTVRKPLNSWRSIMQPIESQQQGGLANSSGSTLEKTVVGTLMSKNFQVVLYREWIKHPEKYGHELLLRNAPYPTLYGHQGNTEFLLTSERYSLTIRIECKWQQSAGSVDEKYPYLYLNCVENMPELEIFLIIDGGGAKAGALTWLRTACKNKLYTNEITRQKTITVFSLAEFLVWANKKLR